MKRLGHPQLFPQHLSRGVKIVLVAVLTMLLAARSSSAQSGATQWDRPIDITQPSSSQVGQFVAMVCDQYQNLHIFWSDIDPSGAALYYRTDADGSWSTPVDVIMQPEHNLLRVNAAISNKTDTLHLIWVDMYLGGNLYYSQVPIRSAGDVRAWSTPRVLAENTEGGSIAVDSQGNIHVIYSSVDEEGRQLALDHIVSDDNGMSWSDPVTAYSTNAALPSAISGIMAIDQADRIHLGVTIRSQEYGAYSEVGYIRSPDDGLTWTTYKKIQDMGTTFQGVSTIAPFVFGRDEVHLTWHDPRRMHQWSMDGGDTWSAASEILPLGAAFGGQNQLVKDSAGTLHAVLATGSGVYSVPWDGAQWGPPEQIDSRPIDPHGQTITTCQGNRLNVAYYDRVGGERVWYSGRQVNAPHIARRPMPAPEPIPQMSSPATNTQATPTPASNAPTVANLTNGLDAPVLSRGSSPVVGAIIPATILVIAAFIFALRARR